MIRLIVILALLTFCSASQLYAQKAELKLALKYYSEADYYQTLEMYRNIEKRYKMDFSKLSSVHKLHVAKSYYLLGDYKNAVATFRLIENLLEDDDIYYYAISLRSRGDYEKAIVWFEKAKGETKSFSLMEVYHQIDNCKWAYSHNLPDPNIVLTESTSFKTYGKSLGVCYVGDKVVYSSFEGDDIDVTEGNHPRKLYCLNQVNGKVVPGTDRKYSNYIRNQFDEGAVAVSPDGKYLYYTKTVELGIEKRTKIFVCEWDDKNSDWSKERQLEFTMDEYNYAHPSISFDYKYIYFSSDRNDGLGGKDIWYAEMISPTDAINVKNCGMLVNTFADEIYPSCMADGSLLFSSDGLYGFGGFDIFKASFVNGVCTSVVNMMKPINSSADDFDYVVSPQRPAFGLLSSNNSKDGVSDVIFYVENKLLSDKEKTIIDKRSDLEPITNSKGYSEKNDSIFFIEKPKIRMRSIRYF